MKSKTRLPGEQYGQLESALVSAFPNRLELTRMVKHQLDRNLAQIAEGDNLNAIVFKLIRWAEANGLVEDLVAGARKENHGNPDLKAFDEQFRTQPGGDGGQHGTEMAALVKPTARGSTTSDLELVSEKNSSDEQTMPSEISERVRSEGQEMEKREPHFAEMVEVGVEQETQPGLEDLYGRGMEWFNERDWQGAIGLFMQVIRVDAEYGDVSEKLAEANRQQMLEIVFNEAMSHFRKRRWNSAREKLEKVLAEEPEYPGAGPKFEEAQKQERLAGLYGQAQDHLLRKDWQHAIAYLRQVVELDPDYEDAGSELEKAQEEYKLEELYEDGVRDLDQRHWHSAKESFGEIDRIRPGGYRDVSDRLEEVNKQLNLAALFEKAQECELAEEWAEAIDVYVGILTEDPVYPDTAERLARAKKKKELLERYRQAESYLARKEWTVAIELFSWIMGRGEDYKDAAQKLQKARNMQEAKVSYMGGLAHFEREEWSQAVEKLQRAFDLDPDSENASKKFEEARRFQKIEDLRREGIRHLMAQEWEKAIAGFEQVLAIDPDDQSAKDLLKEAKRQKQEEEEIRHRTARKLYEEARQLAQAEEWQLAFEKIEEGLQVVPEYQEAIGLRVEVQMHLKTAKTGNAGGGGKPSKKKKKRYRWWVRYVVVPVVVALIGVIVVQLNPRVSPPVAPTASPSLSPTADSAEAGSSLPSPEAVFCNGDFQDNFVCWQHGGELDQAVECSGDQCYAVLGNLDYVCEGGVPVGEAWMKQTLKVPRAISPVLSLRYRIFSQDLDIPGYDYFQVSIDGEPIFERGNDEWIEPSCAREPWDSHWQALTLDLSAYQGEEIEVSFHVYNGTQPYHNTWTYVDDVEIEISQPS